MFFIADNTEYNDNPQNLTIQNVYSFGGLCIPNEQTGAVTSVIENVKLAYSDGQNTPIKYNIKDLRKYYEECSRESVYRALLDNSKKLREDIVNALSDIDYKIIFSLIKSYSSNKGVIKNSKDELYNFVYSNCLMRFALECRYSSLKERNQIILDWPDKGNTALFDKEYYSAYATGKTLYGENYNSGRLSNLNFFDCVSFSNSHKSSLLQAADIFIGIIRGFIISCVKRSYENQETDLFGKIYNKFRGSESRSNLFSRGLVISSTSSEYKDIITKGLEQNGF